MSNIKKISDEAFEGMLASWGISPTPLQRKMMDDPTSVLKQTATKDCLQSADQLKSVGILAGCVDLPEPVMTEEERKLELERLASLNTPWSRREFKGAKKRSSRKNAGVQTQGVFGPAKGTGQKTNTMTSNKKKLAQMARKAANKK